MGLIPDGLTVLYYITKKNNLNQFFSRHAIQETTLSPVNSFWIIINKGLEKFYLGFHNKLHMMKMPHLWWSIVNQFIIFLTALLTF
jgi:hypothetical protein